MWARGEIVGRSRVRKGRDNIHNSGLARAGSS